MGMWNKEPAEKGSNSGYILDLESIGSTDGLETVVKREMMLDVLL